MRTTRAVVGALFFGMVTIVALGNSALSIGVYDGDRDDGQIVVEGDAVLGSSVVIAGDGFGAAAVVSIEIAANAEDPEPLVEHSTTADGFGNVVFTLPIEAPLTPATWVLAMHGQTPDGATRVLWEYELVVSASAHTCKGEVATIVGTDGDDELVGTSGRDVIVGLAGDDEIRGLRGDDLICAGPGDDDVRGGKGADEIHGQQGADTVRGQAGKDLIKGGGGPDRIWGGRGADRIRGNGKADVLKGGSGGDHIKGGSGADDLDGGKGTDRCIGGSGVDTLAGCE